MVVRALKVRAELTSVRRYNSIIRKDNSHVVTFDKFMFFLILIDYFKLDSNKFLYDRIINVIVIFAAFSLIKRLLSPIS